MKIYFHRDPMNIKALTKRCLRAKKLLEDVIAKEAKSNECSMQWIKAHNEMIVFRLQTALACLQDGHATYQVTLQRKGRVPFIEAGAMIEDKVAFVEVMLKEYGIELGNLRQWQTPSPDAARGLNKRKPSEDSGIALIEEQLSKKRRVSTSIYDHEFQTETVRANEAAIDRPRRVRRVRVTHGSSLDDLIDTERSENGDDSDDLQAVSNELKETAPNTPTSLDAKASSFLVSPPSPSLSSPTKYKSPRGRPVKLTLNVNGVKSKGPASSPKFPASPIKPSGPIWNGRGRPAHMPSIPCPEGLNPIVWNAMSYRSQKARLEGLRLLAEMSSEDEDYDA